VAGQHGSPTIPRHSPSPELTLNRLDTPSIHQRRHARLKYMPHKIWLSGSQLTERQQHIVWSHQHAYGLFYV
jgi:hypothetical protein